MCVCVCDTHTHIYVRYVYVRRVSNIYVCDIKKIYNGESNFYHRSNPGLIGRNPQAEEEELNSIIIIIIIIIIITGRDN